MSIQRLRLPVRTARLRQGRLRAACESAVSSQQSAASSGVACSAANSHMPSTCPAAPPIRCQHHASCAPQRHRDAGLRPTWLSGSCWQHRGHTTGTWAAAHASSTCLAFRKLRSHLASSMSEGRPPLARLAARMMPPAAHMTQKDATAKQQDSRWWGAGSKGHAAAFVLPCYHACMRAHASPDP